MINKFLIFPITKEWYGKVEDGTKYHTKSELGEEVVEFREMNDYWNKRVSNFLKELNLEITDEVYLADKDIYGVFSKGYTSEQMGGLLCRIKIYNKEDTDLKNDAGGSDKVYGFHILEPKHGKASYFPKIVYPVTGFEYYVYAKDEYNEELDITKDKSEAINFTNKTKAKQIGDKVLAEIKEHNTLEKIDFQIEKDFVLEKEC